MFTIVLKKSPYFSPDSVILPSLKSFYPSLNSSISFYELAIIFNIVSLICSESNLLLISSNHSLDSFKTFMHFSVFLKKLAAFSHKELTSLTSFISSNKPIKAFSQDSISLTLSKNPEE